MVQIFHPNMYAYVFINSLKKCVFYPQLNIMHFTQYTVKVEEKEPAKIGIIKLQDI